MVCVIVWI